MDAAFSKEKTNREITMEKFRIGVDLGTTNTLVCYMKGGKPMMLKFPGGNMLPSVLYVDEDNSILVGNLAKKKGKRDPLNQIRSSKTEMGNFEKKWVLRGRTFTPTDVATEILREVKKAVIKKVRPEGDLEVEAVITVPAYFTANQIDETKRAGEQAGLTVLGIITEPRAAAIANIKENDIENQKILVADLGGGTFDVSLLEAGRAEYRTLAVDGDRRLGGDDFDERLATYIQSFIEDDLGIDLSSQSASGLEYNTYYRVMADIHEAACETKIELSEETSYEVIVANLLPYKDTMYSLQLPITREKFESLCEDLFRKIRDRISKVFVDTGLTPDDVHSVILAGGSCYIPRIKADVEMFMGQSTDTTMDRSTMVAIGACFVADTWDDPAERDVMDIISHSLGIEVLRDDGTLAFAKLLRRGDVYPCSASREFTTVSDNQERVAITIYEAGSDREDIEDLMESRPDGSQQPIHDLYGAFTLDGIRKARKGEPRIRVTFEYDRSRLLTVTAEDITEDGTGARKRIQVTKGMRAEPAQGKADPVDFVLLIDVSYSMDGSPIRQAREATHKLVHEIIDLKTHQLGIVSFGSRVKEVCPLTSDQERLAQGIDGLTVYGGTEMAGAIRMGAAALRGSKRRKVLLLVTDGDPNNRRSTDDEARKAKQEGVDIITIAVGAGADQQYLAQLASKIDFAFSIKTMDQLGKIFRTAVERICPIK